MPMEDFEGLLCTHWGHWSELEMRRLPRVALQAGQVRLRVRHAGVGHALSLLVAGKYQRKPPLPFTPGTEVAGEIIEVAPDVDHLAPGQRVMAALDWGGYAEEAVVTAATVYPVPDVVALAHAAALPITSGTVWAALSWRARLEPGETLLVHGAAGALGSAAVQIGRLMGARVVATASTAAKREAALRLGAEQALPADGQILPGAFKDAYPAGADVVFDPVGGDLFDASLRCAGQGARLLTVGYASGRIPQVPANILLVKNLSVMGFNYGQYIGWGLHDERQRHAPRVREAMDAVLAAVVTGAMLPPAITQYRFEHWREAVDATMSRRAIGKVILDL
ncbi:MAG: NADPH:quinone oxidoreductase family protein [Achromobacter sp.]